MERISFARRWDPQPWHVDEAQAKASFFGGLTACSAHIFAIYCITSPQWQNGCRQQAIASLGFDELRMLRPVYAGDTLRCVTEIAEARPSASKPDRGVLRYRIAATNQNGETVLTVIITSMVKRKRA